VKKLFTFLAAALFATTTFAQQVPNAGFETWQTKTGIGMTGPFTYSVPQNWELGFISELLASFGMAPNVAKSPVAGSGSFALRINSNADSIGSDLSATFNLGPNARPAALTGTFSTSGIVTDPNDYGQAFIFLTKWNGTSRDTIGFGAADLSSSPTVFTSFTAPITYSSSANPDTAIAYMLYFPEEANTHVIIDDLALISLLGTKENTTLAQFKFFPNPVSDNATITFNAASSEKGSLIIRDMTGREIKNQALGLLKAGANTIPVNTAGLKAGLYTATLQTATSNQTLRFEKR
jgi:hypothetical protein